MTEYKPNSHKYKEEQRRPEKKKMEKVVTNPVKVKKKGGVSKITDVFLTEDINNVKSYIFSDVLIPSIKKAIYDMVVGALDMSMFGGTGRSGKKSGNASYVSYNSISQPQHRDYRSAGYGGRVGGQGLDDIVFNSRGEAEEVLDRLTEAIRVYGQVSILDLYDLIGETSTPQDDKYGWTNLRNAGVQRTRDGYLLKMPKAMPID
jgi:hypothetical protein